MLQERSAAQLILSGRVIFVDYPKAHTCPFSGNQPPGNKWSPAFRWRAAVLGLQGSGPEPGCDWDSGRWLLLGLGLEQGH